MDDAATRACFLAIRERIKIINQVRVENSPQAEKAGLISAYLVIDALARRFIRAPEWPGHEVEEFTRLVWEYEWYSQYCEATTAFCKAMQLAVKNKHLTLRNPATRLPVDQPALNSWLLADIDALQFDVQNGFMSRLPSLSPILGRWPDNACLPPTGAIIPEDVAVWVVAEGLASPDDALLLPTCKLKPQTATPAPVVAGSDAPAWTVNKPQRYSGYAAPLHRFLAAAHREGKPRPTARDVLEAWRSERPAGIAKVLADGFDYFDANGDEKTADLEAIRKAMGRMTNAR